MAVTPTSQLARKNVHNMKKYLLFGFGLASVFLARIGHAADVQPAPIVPSTAQAAVVPPADDELRLRWKNGLALESVEKGGYSGKIGGRIQFDGAAIGQDSKIDGLTMAAPDAVEVRRLRLFVAGEFDGAVRTVYKAQIEFAGAKVKFADVYVGLKRVPFLGTILVGQQYEPFSTEQLTSDNYLTFLERALPVTTFDPDRQLGVRIFNNPGTERATWSVGVFTRTLDSSAAKVDGNVDLAARVTGVPWYADNGKRLLHLGLSGILNYPTGDKARFSTRPEAHLVPEYVDTKEFAGKKTGMGNAEVAVVLGSLSAQGQFIYSRTSAPGIIDPSFHGMTANVSYFLTGEHRPYDMAEGIFSRVKPKRTLGSGGPGAWELAFRVSAIDLDDSVIMGGRLLDLTGGVTWYLNPNARMMLNYVNARLDRGGIEAQAHVVQGRFQADF